MNSPFLFVLPILLTANQYQDLPVTLKSYDPSCKNHVAAGASPSLDWQDDKTAIVRVRIPFEHGVSASSESPHAYLKGNHINVCYNTNVRPIGPHEPIPMCIEAEDLEFTISELPRSDYLPRVSRCGAPQILYYKCAEGGKNTYTIYQTQNCTPVTSDED